MMMNFMQFGYSVLLVMMMVVTQSHAQKLPSGVFATVNGQPLSESLLDVNIQSNIGRGITDTPQLRAALKNELIGQEVLAQETRRLKLDQTQQAKALWDQMQQNYLASLLLSNHDQTNQVSEAQIKNEYDNFLKEMTGAKEYRISIITLPTQARANEVITQLNQSKDKELFARFAKAESSDPSKSQGGQLGWLLLQQMLTAVSNVVVNLEKGKMSAVPIQTPSGWNIVRVDDFRPYKLPNMKELEPQLIQAANRKVWLKYIQDLRDKAKVVR